MKNDAHVCPVVAPIHLQLSDDGYLKLSGTANALCSCSANVVLGHSRIVSDRRH
jgi:hypothetical protein